MYIQTNQHTLKSRYSLHVPPGKKALTAWLCGLVGVFAVCIWTEHPFSSLELISSKINICVFLFLYFSSFFFSYMNIHEINNTNLILEQSRWLNAQFLADDIETKQMSVPTLSDNSLVLQPCLTRYGFLQQKDFMFTGCWNAGHGFYPLYWWLGHWTDGLGSCFGKHSAMYVAILWGTLWENLP